MKASLSGLKRTLCASSLCLAVVFSPVSSLALTVKEVPNPQQVYGGWVTDMAEVLTPETESHLNQIISQLEAKNGTEIAVVTVSTIAPAASSKIFTTELFNYWEIGKADADNGVLFLIAIGDRRVEIETGYGVEGILPDAKVGRIIDTQIIPRFKQGDFQGGILAGTEALVVALDSDRSSLGGESTAIPWVLLAGGGGLALIIGFIAFVKRPRRVFLEPEGRALRGSAVPRSRYKSGDNLRIYCSNCKQPMKRVDRTILQSALSKPEKVARQLGSIKFEGWQCTNCSQARTNQKFHLVAYVSNSPQFLQCPNCRELTVTRTKNTIRAATEYNTGKLLIFDKCHCCSYNQEKEEIIPRLPPPPPPSSSSWGGDSSGGGSFGGGSSGGGGAGGSW